MKRIIYAADTETSVYQGQKETEVWSSAFCPVRTAKQQETNHHEPTEADCILHSSLDQSYRWLISLDNNIVLYYHNLKFDGSFWIDWLYKHGYEYKDNPTKEEKRDGMILNTLIGDLGQWYCMRVYLPNGHSIEMLDSLKILPFTLRQIGKDFKTKHQKLDMEYMGERHAGYKPTEKEAKYIKNDVLVLAEALEIMFNNKIDKMTIGSSCLKNYKNTISEDYYKETFIDLSKIQIDNNSHDYGSKDADTYIRKGYHGGWCYSKDDKSGIVYNLENCKNYNKKDVKYIGLTADVNSLYPSMMHSSSGNRYPVGLPHFVEGDKIIKYIESPQYYSFLRINCQFNIKDKHLPFIQIKGNKYYKPTTMQKDSRPTFKGKRVDHIIKEGKEIASSHVTLTLSETDYKLFKEHYNIYNMKIIDGCWFYTDIGMFDNYINHWMKIKMRSHNAIRQISKLMLNNLYGKTATSPNNITKIPVLKDGSLVLEEVKKENKDAGYIAMGAAITSYARAFTITAAQKNFDSFCYADTDSIHCLCSREDIKGIKVHPTNLSCWKLESFWDEAIFVRPKTYIEHMTHNDEEPIEPLYNIKCAGMPDKCKELLNTSFLETDEQAESCKKMAESIAIQNPTDKSSELYLKYKFLGTKRTLKDFKEGLQVPGKLIPRRIPGGIVLLDVPYTMNPKLEW